MTDRPLPSRATQRPTGRSAGLCLLARGVAMLLLIALASCSESAPGPADPTPDSKVHTVEVSGPPIILGSGARWSATARTKDGFLTAGRDLVWSTADPTIATIDSEGDIHGVGIGSTTVSARIDGVTGEGTVFVQPGSLGSIEITSERTELLAGSAISLGVVLRNTNGARLPFEAVAWSVDVTTIVRISQDGVATGQRSGSAIVRGAVRGVTGSLALRVVAAEVARIVLPATFQVGEGETASIPVRLEDPLGGEVVGVPVGWTSTDPSVATVSDGLVRGVRVGGTILTASAGGVTATTSVQVLSAVASLVAWPSVANLRVGAGHQAGVSALDPLGRPITDRVPIWTSLAPEIVQVDPSGWLVGVSPGSARIVATMGGLSDTITAHVVGDPGGGGVASVQVSGPAIEVGTSQTFQAVARRGDGSTVTGLSPAWSSDDPSIATVSADGSVTGVSVGTATISATIQGVTGSAPAVVWSGGVADIQLVPSATTIQTGQQVSFVVSARTADGTVVPDPPLTWSVSDPAVLRLVSAGVVEGLGSGVAEVTASSGAASATIVITVEDRRVATIEMHGSSIFLGIGEDLPIPVRFLDSDGVEIAAPTAVWTSADESTVRVSQAGVLTGVRPGQAVIIVSVHGVIRGTTATVTNQITTLNIIPSALSLRAGQGSQAVFTAFDIDGRPVFGREPIWSSLTPGVVSVSSSGWITGLAGGTGLIQATLDTGVDTAVVTVTGDGNGGGGGGDDRTVGSVEITKGNHVVVLASSLLLQSVVRDSNGEPYNGQFPEWTSSDPTIASVDGSGRVSGHRPGTVVIRAQVGQVWDTVSVRTRVATVEVAVDSLRMTEGESITLSATGRDANGAVVADWEQNWISTDSSVVRPSATGFLEALSPGFVTVTVQDSPYARQMIPVRVLPRNGAVRLVASPDTLVIEPGQLSVDATFTAYDADGAVIEGITDFRWSAEGSTVATVEASGRITGSHEGTADVFVFVGDLSARITVVVRWPTGAPSVLDYARESMVLGKPRTYRVQTTNAGARTLMVVNGRELPVRADVFRRWVEASIPDSVLEVGNATILLRNPGAEGGDSEAWSAPVAPAGFVQPTVSRTGPPLKAGEPSTTTLVIVGSNFTRNSVVVWNGQDRVTNYVSPNRIETTLSVADQATAGTATLVIRDTETGISSPVYLIPIVNP